jgi:glycosyltransferase involved in cell wall biosynthesis
MIRSIEFSIVIPTRNRLKFLQQALDSVWAQTLHDYEIVVVDDGSTDGTGDYLASLDDRIKSIHGSTRGPAAARNLGVSQAKGEYIAFLDSDDLWLPWTLATYHKLIQNYQPSLISAATFEFEGKLPTIEQKPIVVRCFSDYFAATNDYVFVGCSALVVRRSVFERANGFEESMFVAEDHDFYMRTGTSAGFVYLRSPITVAYRRHPGNISISPSRLYRGAIELLTKESKGRYPGGKERKRERWQVLSRIVRPVVLACLKSGLENEAWRLYGQSVRMNIQLARFRFLIGFPLCGLLGWVLGYQSALELALLSRPRRSYGLPRPEWSQCEEKPARGRSEV